MAKKLRLPDVQLEVVGHELIDVNVKKSRGVIEKVRMVRLKFRGVAGDRKTRMTFEVDPQFRQLYPLGGVMLQSMTLQQTELPMDEDGEAEDESPPVRPGSEAAQRSGH